MKLLVDNFIPLSLAVIVLALCTPTEAGCRHNHHYHQITQKPLLNDFIKHSLIITSDFKTSNCIDKFTPKNDLKNIFLIWKNLPNCQNKNIAKTEIDRSNTDMIKLLFKNARKTNLTTLKTTTTVKPTMPTLKTRNTGNQPCSTCQQIHILNGNKYVYNIKTYITHHYHYHNGQGTDNGNGETIEIVTLKPKIKDGWFNDVPLSR